MAPALWTISAVIGGLAGCTRSPVNISGLTFIDRAEVPIPVATITSPKLDDGFGTAVTAAMERVWIGAPHGDEGALYVWDEDELSIQLQGPGRLGSHLASSAESLWVAAPTQEQVLSEAGAITHQGQSGMGIALGDAGYVGWASGWIGPDGSTGETTSRPTAIHRRGDEVGIGMAHGDVAFAVGTNHWDRPRASDEAGFAVTSGLMQSTPVWIIGAPASGHVYALHADTLEIAAVWSGSGRFGHAVAVADVDGDHRDDLVVGAPYDGITGRVFVFYDFGDEETTLDTAGSAAAGSAIDVGDGRLVIGAPGDPQNQGRVFVLTLRTQGRAN